jgi:hypothetical protein
MSGPEAGDPVERPRAQRRTRRAVASVALTVVDEVIEVETRRYPETPDLEQDERWETVIRPASPPFTEDIFEVLGPLATPRDAQVMHERAVEYVVRALDTTVRPRRPGRGTVVGP